MKTSEPPLILLRNQEYPVEPGIPLKSALLSLHLEPESYLAVRAGLLMQPDEILQPGDIIKLVAVIAGG